MTRLRRLTWALPILFILSLTHGHNDLRNDGVDYWPLPWSIAEMVDA